MNFVNPIKLTITAAGFIVGIVGFSSTANAGYNLCEIETVPAVVIQQTIKHPDFDKVLEKMLIVCPGAALNLTEAATATINSNSGERDGGGDGGAGTS